MGKMVTATSFVLQEQAASPRQVGGQEGQMPQVRQPSRCSSSEPVNISASPERFAHPDWIDQESIPDPAEKGVVEDGNPAEGSGR